MSLKHKAQALAVHCIDYRFQKMIDEDLASRGLTDTFDRIAIPGASKNFDEVLKHCQTSLKLHDPDQVLIYEHEDCGAYENDNSPQSHGQNAQKLASALKEIKPNLKIILLMATFEGIKDHKKTHIITLRS